MTTVNESRDPKELLRRLYLELNRYRQEIDRLRQPIAIVGMACRFPGGGNIAEFWASLLAGRCLSQGLPPGRDLYRDGVAVDDTDEVCRHGAFLAGIDRFDAEFFQIAPVEAQYLDPQHRMLLETSWHALEEAGINPDHLRGQRAGVYAGVCGNDYRELVAASDGARSVYIATGTSDSTAIGRVAFALGLEGPAIAIDTACSSSLVAIHQAVTALQQGEVDLALAGGVNVILSTGAMDAFDNGGMLAADGRCKTFDAAADGYVRGEGCAMIALRRLADAEADGDRIHAVIRGTAVNQDGASAGLTVPNGPAQERVIAAALARAGLDPSEVDYLEAHGTGTRLGDPIEIHAAAAAYGRDRPKSRPLLIGSVKTNIGHLEAAAGVAGLIKATLALGEDRIPPHVNFSVANPAVDWPGSKVRVVTGIEDWPVNGDRPPRAGVSSFGFSGTNAHLVLEGYRQPNVGQPCGGVVADAIEIPLPDGAVATERGRQERLLPLSGRSEAAVRALAEHYLDRLHEAESATVADDLADLAWSASISRSQFDVRAGIVFRDGTGLSVGLKDIMIGRTLAPAEADAKAGFLYTGQGSQWAGMGRTLYETEPVARGVFDRCEQVMCETTGESLLQIMFAPECEALDSTAWTQPALYALGCALTAQWNALGIRPKAVLGHSVGELAAAQTAGVFSLEDGMRFAIHRGRIMAAVPGDGAMAAIHGSRSRVETIIREVDGPLSIAADNGTHVVISGSAIAVERVCDVLLAAGMRTERLRTSHAFHSALMDPVLDELERIAPSGAVPGRPLIGNVTGEELKETPGPLYWRRQARHEVAFATSVARLAAHGINVLVEIGPRAVLGPLARAIWPAVNEPPTVVTSLREPKADGTEPGFATAAGMAWEAGLPVRLKDLYTGERRRRTALPTYPFQRQRHWVDTGRRRAATRMHPVTGDRHDSASGETTFELGLSASHPAWLADYRVFGRPLVPPLLVGGLATVAGDGMVLEDLEVRTPFPLGIDDGEAAACSVQIVLDRADGGGNRRVTIHGRTEQTGAWTLIAEGHLSVAPPLEERTRTQPDGLERIDLTELRRTVLDRGIECGLVLESMTSTWIGDGETLVQLDLAPDPDGTLMTGPLALEACVQSLVAAVPGTVCRLPVGWKRLHVVGTLPERVFGHARLIPDSEQDGRLTADIDLFGEDGVPLGQIRGLVLQETNRSALQSSTDGLDDLLYRMDWREVPQLQAPPPPEQGTWILNADQGGVARELAVRLAERQQNVVLAGRIRPGPDESIPGVTAAFLETDRREAWSALVRNLPADAPLRGVVDLTGLDCHSDPAQSVDPGSMLVDTGAAALALVQGLDDAGMAPTAGIRFVTKGAQIIGTERSQGIAGAVLWGFARTVGLEMVHLAPRLVDIDPDAPVDLEVLLDEMLSESDETEIAWRNGQRLAARLVSSTDMPPRADLAPTGEGIWLITGGLGGLGLEVAAWLAERGVRKIVLNVRREPDEARQAAIDALVARGIEVRLEVADVAQREAVDAMLERIALPLAGIIHCAGATTDAGLGAQDRAGLERALLAKAVGAWNLHQALADHEPGVFVLFSSVAGVLGNPGQANYAAANAFLDQLASWRSVQGQAGQSIAWGPWAGAGMAERNRDRLAGRMEAQGMDWIALPSALAVLDRLMGAEAAMTLAVSMDWLALVRQQPSLTPLLGTLLPASTAGTEIRAGRGGLAIRLRESAPGDREALLVRVLSDELQAVLMLPSAPPPSTGFFELGMDSLTATELRNRLNRVLLGSYVVPATIAFDYPNVASLARHLAEELGETPRAVEAPLLLERAGPIAIVGMACRFPGGDGLDGFRSLLSAGDSAIGPPPPDRTAGEREGAGQRAGGFLEAIDLFDAEFFRIAPVEAKLLDPQQRLLLETSWHALEDAGMDPGSLRGSRTGVYAGISMSDYRDLLVAGSGTVGLHSATGTSASTAIGRIAYTLGLEGPAMAIDTACSSSLVAIHQAAVALQRGEADLALAGGVNAILSMVPVSEFVESGMLAPDGQCRTFDAAANGYGRGEGCGMVVLRRLADAVAAGDRIWGVLRASAVNQDGASAGLTVPNGPAQERVIAEALARSGLTPAEIDYLEAHGTGTELGDPIEVGAAAAVYGRNRPADRPLLIGSVKTNIGHLEAAAGVAGLIKVMLAMASRRLPRHLNFSTPNPHIDWDSLPVQVVSAATDWPYDGDRPPRAALSSFGFSGTNAHVILEGAPPPDAGDLNPTAVVGASVAVPLPEASAAAKRGRGERLLPLSGRSATAVSALAGQYLDWLREDQPEPHEDHLADMAWTAATGRGHLEFRAGLIFSDRKGLVAGLGALARGDRQIINGARSRPAFLFTGQGSQWVGMGRELYETEPVVRGVLDQCEAAMLELRGESLLDVMFASAGSAVDDTYWTQPALYSLACALAAQWQSLGVKPAALLGHSVGELAAAQVAGMVPLVEGLRFAARRGALMASLPDRGAMAAVFAPRDQVETTLAADGGSDLSVAADNGTHLVLSGPVPAVERIREAFTAAGIRTAPLRTRQAFHSALMDPILDELELAAPHLSPPTIPLLSNVTGRELTEAPDGGYWRHHARGEVAFAAGAARLAALEIDILIEIGPKAILGPLVQDGWPGDGPVPHAVASLDPPVGGVSPAGFAGAVAAAWETGLPLRLEGLFTGERRRRVSLPTYPFQRQRHWIDGRSRRRAYDHPLLGTRTELLDGSTVYEVEVSTTDPDWLADHRVFGRPVVPGALFAVLAAAAAAPDGPVSVEAFQIHSPLILKEDGSPWSLQVMAGSPDAQGVRNVTIGGRGPDGGDWVRHAEARVLMEAEPRLTDSRPIAEPAGSDPAGVEVPELYHTLARAGAEFGPAFRRIAEARRSPGAAFAEAVLTDGPAMAGTFMHPTLLDGVFQTVAAAGEFGDTLYMPFGCERLRFWGPMPQRLICRTRLRETPDPDTLVADIELADGDGTPVGEVSGFTARRAARSQLQDPADSVDGLLYETVWRPVSEPGGLLDASFLSAPEAVGAAVGGIDGWLLEQGVDQNAPAELEGDLERLSVCYACQALDALGWRPGFGRGAGDLRTRLKVVRPQEALLERVLELAMSSDREPERDPAAMAASLARRHPFAVPEIRLLAHCGEPLADVLRGRRDPVDLLFGEAGAGAAELYRESPMLRAANRMLASTVATMADALPAGRTLRILEVGGGTGATTEAVLDALPTGRFSYTFTDVSAAFLDPARRRFQDYSPVFDVLDIERDPREQGFAAHGFDIVIGANVLHATRDLGESLRHCQRLLAPEGCLVLLEGLARQGWLDITFGLLEGWWRYADEWRLVGPLIDGKGWRQALTAAGYDGIEVLTAGHGRAGRALQGVILAQAPSETAETAGSWVIASPQAKPALALARSLVERNQAVIVASPDIPSESSPIHQFPLELEWREAWRALIGEIPDEVPFAGIVLLTGTDPAGSDPATAADRVSAQALALVQGVDDSGRVPASGVWFASCGGQVVDGAQAAGLATSVLGGFVRTVALELPSLGARLVDLDPSEPDPANRLVGELLGSDRETAVAWRAGTRYAARLARLEGGGRIRIPREGSWRLVADGGGSLESLRAQPFSPPALRKGEVRVGVLAAGINFHDVLAAMRLVDAGAPLGGDLCGRVIEAGPGASFEPGDWVVGFATPSFASEVVTSAELLASAPPDLSPEELATMPTAFTTAALAFRMAGLKGGERVLVHAAAGGVGQAAVRLARQIGAETLATASAGKRDLVRSLGVAHVFDSRCPGFGEGILQATSGAGVDVVLNCLTGDGFIESSLASLAPGGRFVEISKRGIWSTAEMAEARPDVTYHVLALDELLRTDSAAVGNTFRGLMERHGSSGIAPLPFRAWPMAEAGAAMSRMRRGEHVGKLVLTAPAADRLAGTWLITGGLGGLGLAVADWLADRGAEAVVLNGRSEPDGAQEAAVTELRNRGIEVRVELADVSDGTAVEAMLERTVATLPALTGIVHAAGTLSDGALSNLSHERFREVTAAKVRGAWNLHRLTVGMKLDRFVLFSSLAGVTGNAGQANHAAANSFLDQLARHRRAMGLPGQAIAWGAWLGIGKAEAERERISDRIAVGGVGWMPPQQGIACLDRLLHEEPSVGVAAPVDWKRFVQGRRDDPFMDEVLPIHPISTVPGVADDLPTRLDAAPQDRREQLMIEFLQGEVEAALQLGVPPSPDALFADLGMDSLMAVEIRNRLNRAMAGAYTASGAIAFNFPTIRSLSRHLLSELGYASPEHATGQRSDDPDRAEVETLSAQELFAAVAAELGEEP